MEALGGQSSVGLVYPLLTTAVADTGGWQSWRSVPGNVAAVTGRHTVFLTFTSAQPADFVSLNWFQFRR